ncbi:hypothetical protein H8E88_11095 [candidate division KSB1 bacterium]|nr:hypothetical protein [candidate division KSB1 bacterium]
MSVKIGLKNPNGRAANGYKLGHFINQKDFLHFTTDLKKSTVISWQNPLAAHPLGNFFYLTA